MRSVSVVVAAFNAAEWLQHSLGSILAQTHEDFELIVVDDGSTDGTAAVVESVSGPRLRLIRQENKGQCAALNRGAREARGDYIKFLDADDWLNPGHLAAQVAALNGHPDQVASCRWGYFVDDPTTARVRSEHADRDYADPLEWIVDSLTLDEGMVGGWRWLIPRRVWNHAAGWDERLSLNNDFDFSIRLLLASKGVRFAHDAVYGYRKGVSDALSGSRGRAAMESAFHTTESGCRHLLEHEDSARIRRICANRWQQWLYQFYPEQPDLAERAESEIAALGGSSIRLQGGRMLRLLLPLLGWKRVRHLQVVSRRLGWNRVLAWKAARRRSRLLAA